MQTNNRQANNITKNSLDLWPIIKRQSPFLKPDFSKYAMQSKIDFCKFHLKIKTCMKKDEKTKLEFPTEVWRLL